MVVARDFHRHDFLAQLRNLDDLVEVAAVVPDPLAGQVGHRSLDLGRLTRLNHLPHTCHSAARAQSGGAKFSTESSFGNARTDG
jgi:hypothetical protein